MALGLTECKKDRILISFDGRYSVLQKTFGTHFLELIKVTVQMNKGEGSPHHFTHINQGSTARAILFSHESVEDVTHCKVFDRGIHILSQNSQEVC